MFYKGSLTGRWNAEKSQKAPFLPGLTKGDFFIKMIVLERQYLGRQYVECPYKQICRILKIFEGNQYLLDSLILLNSKSYCIFITGKLLFNQKTNKQNVFKKPEVEYEVNGLRVHDKIMDASAVTDFQVKFRANEGCPMLNQLDSKWI